MENFEKAYIDYIDYAVEEKLKTFCPTFDAFLEVFKNISADTDNCKLLKIDIEYTGRHGAKFTYTKKFN